MRGWVLGEMGGIYVETVSEHIALCCSIGIQSENVNRFYIGQW